MRILLAIGTVSLLFTGFILGGGTVVSQQIPSNMDPVRIELTQYGDWGRYNPTNGRYMMQVRGIIHGLDNPNVKIDVSEGEVQSTSVWKPNVFSTTLLAFPNAVV